MGRNYDGKTVMTISDNGDYVYVAKFRDGKCQRYRGKVVENGIKGKWVDWTVDRNGNRLTIGTDGDYVTKVPDEEEGEWLGTNATLLHRTQCDPN